jgi:hypothetical protein
MRNPTNVSDVPTESSGIRSNEYLTLRAQRELALACACLSFAISLAVLLSNFGKEPAAIPAAREAVENHQKILASAEDYFKANVENLQQNREALAKVKQSMGLKTP